MRRVKVQDELFQHLASRAERTLRARMDRHSLCFGTNDPANGLIQIPVGLTVAPNDWAHARF